MNNVFQVVYFKGYTIALTICEDLWTLPDNRKYELEPLQELIKQNPDLIINIAASPFSCNHDELRKHIMCNHANNHKIPLCFVNQIGAQTNLIFDGGSFVVNDNLSVSYEREDSEKHFINNATTDIEQSSDAIQAAYTMGGMTLAVSQGSYDGVGYVADKKATQTLLAVTMAF